MHCASKSIRSFNTGISIRIKKLKDRVRYYIRMKENEMNLPIESNRNLVKEHSSAVLRSVGETELLRSSNQIPFNSTINTPKYLTN